MMVMVMCVGQLRGHPEDTDGGGMAKTEDAVIWVFSICETSSGCESIASAPKGRSPSPRCA